MKKIFVISATILLSLLTFSRCNHNNGEDNGNDNIDQCALVDVDGNCYDTVHIGNQVWMKSNLRTTHFRDGSAIPVGGNNMSDTDPYCYTDVSIDTLEYAGWNIPNYDIYVHGLYYNASAVHDNRGLCPTGWHVPSDAEWIELGRYVLTHYDTYFDFLHNYGDEYYEEYAEDFEGLQELDDYFPIAKTLASQTGWVYDYLEESEISPGWNFEYNNSTGFSAYPAGHCYGNDLAFLGFHAYFWTSTSCEDYNNCTWSLGFNYFDPSVYRGEAENSMGNPVRCVRD